jgi:hypothetical protein
VYRVDRGIYRRVLEVSAASGRDDYAYDRTGNTNPASGRNRTS